MLPCLVLGFHHEQVGKLLASLHINPLELPAGAPPGAGASWDQIFQATGPRSLQQAALASDHAAATAAMASARPQWVDEFQSLKLEEQGRQAVAGPPGSAGWSAEFAAQQQQQQQPWGWAEEYQAEQAAPSSSSEWVDEFQSSGAASAVRQRGGMPGDALEQTRKLADTLAANKDPKFQNSKFLQVPAVFLFSLLELVQAVGGPCCWSVPGAGDDTALSTPHIPALPGATLQMVVALRLNDFFPCPPPMDVAGRPYLQFLSKMSRGEYILEDNQVGGCLAVLSWLDEGA